VGYYTLQFCDYFICGPIGRREIFPTSSLLVEIEGHFSLEFVNYVCETEDWSHSRALYYYPQLFLHVQNLAPFFLTGSLVIININNNKISCV
jgi:hypothetical protein